MKTNIEFKATGVTLGARQHYLAYLRKQPDVHIKLYREPDKPRAIQILAETSKVRLAVGYVPQDVAASLASLMDNHTFINVDKFRITGGSHQKGLYYGMSLQASY